MSLLEVEDLCKTFEGPAHFFGSQRFNAVDNVSFTLAPKQTLAIIGKNGSGKRHPRPAYIPPCERNW